MGVHSACRTSSSDAAAAVDVVRASPACATVACIWGMTTWMECLRDEGLSVVDDEGAGMIAWERTTGLCWSEDMAIGMLVAGVDRMEAGLAKKSAHSECKSL